MKPEVLEKLNAFCADFKKFRDNTNDGKGNNLNDIKNTFDYVVKTVEQYQLSGTKFGANLTAKAKEASKVLSELRVCLEDLEKSLSNFTNKQASNNNQAGGGATISSGAYTSNTGTRQYTNPVVKQPTTPQNKPYVMTEAKLAAKSAAANTSTGTYVGGSGRMTMMTK